MFNLGMGEITVILLLALIFLGPSKLPDLAAGLGKLIREIRKATSDVKNEIALDETFRKPFEDLRDAVTLHPDELKRRDQWAKEREEAAKRALEEAEAAAKAVSALAAETQGGLPIPPDGPADNVKLDGNKLDDVSKPVAGMMPATPALPTPNHGPNDTVVQTAPARGATLDDVPTPPPEAPVAKPASPPQRPLDAAVKPASPFKPLTPAKPAAAPGLPPTGTVARPDAVRGAMKPAASAAPLATPPKIGESASNTTQILREEDLIPTSSSGTPPPPPHLPGLRPAGAPRPTGAPPLPTVPADKKKP
ncbi:MAG TPA: twin-arginine translocase TatA/TatE family subunit [Polyangia bacterium]